MKVHILTDRNFVSFYFFYPLLANHGRLKGMGTECHFFEHPCEALWQADVILVDSKVLGKIEPFEDVLELLHQRQSEGCKVVWLDSSASSGTTHFQVLPYVAAYWKKQLLHDRTHYRRELVGGRLFTDYYHHNMGCEVENSYYYTPLDKMYEGKVSVSWNLGVGAYGMHTRLGNLLRKIPWSLKPYFPYRYLGKPTAVGRHRPVEIAFRGSKKYTNSATAYQRVHFIEQLEPRGVETVPVDFTSYWRELQSSRIAVSPFGFGETCYRDFEIFFAGAALLKPDMGHQENYPDFFRADETYIPVAWDFSNLDVQLERYLSDSDKLVELAVTGQENYLAFRSKEGQEQFCMRFVGKVEAV